MVLKVAGTSTYCCVPVSLSFVTVSKSYQNKLDLSTVSVSATKMAVRPIVGATLSSEINTLLGYIVRCY